MIANSDERQGSVSVRFRFAATFGAYIFLLWEAYIFRVSSSSYICGSWLHNCIPYSSQSVEHMVLELNRMVSVTVMSP